MSKNEGKQFEEDWKGSYSKTSYYYMRLRDGAKWVQSQASAFTPENPCDAIQHTMPFLWLLELKTNGSGSISFYPFTDDGGFPWKKPKGKAEKDIKTNQVKEIMDAVKTEGIIGGFVLNFRERILKKSTHPPATYFVHISDFLTFARESGKASINVEDCEKIGILISQKKKVKNYKYDIENFVNEAVVTYIKRGHIDKSDLKNAYDWIGKLLSAV